MARNNCFPHPSLFNEPTIVFTTFVTAFTTRILTTIQGISTSKRLSVTRSTLLQDGLSLYIFQTHHLFAPKTQKNL